MHCFGEGIFPCPLLFVGGAAAHPATAGERAEVDVDVEVEVEVEVWEAGGARGSTVVIVCSLLRGQR